MRSKLIVITIGASLKKAKLLKIKETYFYFESDFRRISANSNRPRAGVFRSQISGEIEAIRHQISSDQTARSPHLNGKVERSQRTDLEEFYPTVDLKDPTLPQKLADWQDYYNEFRPHGSLNSKTPWEKWNELAIKTPYRDEVEAAFDESKERLQLQNYRDDLYWQKLKRSL
jgi:hypothetical protein